MAILVKRMGDGVCGIDGTDVVVVVVVVVK